MMILTNGLTDVVDEGFLKVANSLIKRIKTTESEITVVSYERRSAFTDIYININKFMLSRQLIGLCRKHKNVLYVPFPAKKTAMALRVFLLSFFTKKLRVVLVLKTPIGAVGKFLLKQSGAKIVVLSADAADFYGKIIGREKVTYLKTGVDTNKFSPVLEETAKALKIKYGFDPDKRIVLHVGHLNEGRNIRELLKVSQEHQVLLVTSTLTKNEQNIALKEELLSKPNIRIIDDYIADIEEIYQLSDVYFFPVIKSGNCIDVPLSCLEAAACGKPIVTTDYGEMKEFFGKDGFYFIDDTSEEAINEIINKALEENVNPRGQVLNYDWDNAVKELAQM